MSGSDPIVAVEVRRRFGRKIVLKDLDLRVPEGSTTALLGRNGAGKSTLIRILAGLLPRHGGEVRVLGMDPGRRAKAVKAATGYVPETTPFHPRWRVRDAIDLSKAFRRKTWNVAEEKRLLEVFALDPRAKIGSLSKGFRAKLALLLALAHTPRVILLDEPASGLDPIVRREVLASLVDAIHGEGRTVLLSSHLMEDVERLADRVAFLAGGRIVLDGELAEVRTRARRIVVGPVPAGEPLGDLPGLPVVERREHEALLTYLEGADEAADALRATGRFRDVDVLHMNLTDLFVDLLSEEHEVLSPCAR